MVVGFHDLINAIFIVEFLRCFQEIADLLRKVSPDPFCIPKRKFFMQCIEKHKNLLCTLCHFSRNLTKIIGRRSDRCIKHLINGITDFSLVTQDSVSAERNHVARGRLASRIV